MSFNRRFVLKGMALSGMAGLTLGSALPALAGQLSGTAIPHSTNRRVLALSGNGAAEALFLQGAKAAGGNILQVQPLSQDLNALLNLEHQLRRAEPLRIVGLLDDASATLALSVARSAGAKVQWVGQHSNNNVVTRHRLLSTDSSQVCTQRFNQQLMACGAIHPRNELPPAESASAGHLSTSSHPSEGVAEWLSSLGYLLASLGREPALPMPAPTGGTSPTGSFVSFLIET